jgi:predicted pyridoxine 5'-phosphate oxidase superfamily flavin-nucleotide-binding protein
VATRAAKDTQAVLRAAPLQAASPAFSTAEEQPDRALDDTEALGAGATMTTAEDAWPDRMAKMIAALCTRADPAFVTWTVTVPMDPQVLPDTELRLHLSPHWLSLRFATQSQRAARLISLHRPRLQSQLEHMANLPHGIDIEVI